MSYEFNLYLKEVDDSIIPKWLELLGEMGAKCEMHPEFSFCDQSGFLPFKVSFSNLSIPGNDGSSFLTGFELDVCDYTSSLVEEQNDVKISLWKKIFRKNNNIEEKDGTNAVIKYKLKNSSRELIFSISSQDVFEFPLALYSAAIISLIKDGVLFDPQEGKYLENKSIIEKVQGEVKEYFDSLSPQQWNYHKFEQW
jgi:hypothetical protein